VVGNECTCRSAFDVLREPGWGIAFVDPPYDGTETTYAEPWGEPEHRMLRNVLVRSRRPWLLTYTDTPLIRSLYPESEFVVTVEYVRRVMNPYDPRPELWISPRHETIYRLDTPGFIIDRPR
jgi:site-specific DNA-adenine methylase